MKFLHLSDLHLGKRMNDVSLLEDQAFVLEQAVAAAKAEQVDAVLIAGDVYQKASPPAEAMSLFNDFLTKLAALDVKIFIISGNHDSHRRISYLSELVRSAGVYVSEDFTGTLQQFTLTDEYGPITISLLPFIKPVTVKSCFPEEAVPSYQAAAELVLARSPIDSSVRNVLVCHQFITGAETSDSEERSVGGLDNISGDIFKDFDYVALGHIHKPQKISRDTMRYAGSPLKYSFSEINHKKSLCIAELKEKGTVEIRTIPLQFLRDVRDVRGSLAEIMAMDYSEDYVRVTVTDELVPPDARVTVSTVFPNMMLFGVENSKTGDAVTYTEADDVENKSLTDLFCDFFRMQNNDAPPSEDLMQLLTEVLEELKEASHETD